MLRTRYHIALLISVCVLAASLSGCGFVKDLLKSRADMLPTSAPAGWSIGQSFGGPPVTYIEFVGQGARRVYVLVVPLPKIAANELMKDPQKILDQLKTHIGDDVKLDSQVQAKPCDFIGGKGTYVEGEEDGEKFVMAWAQKGNLLVIGAGVAVNLSQVDSLAKTLKY